MDDLVTRDTNLAASKLEQVVTLEEEAKALTEEAAKAREIARNLRLLMGNTDA